MFWLGYMLQYVFWFKPGWAPFGAFFIAIANLCIDIVYAYVDPRVRFS